MNYMFAYTTNIATDRTKAVSSTDILSTDFV